MAQQTGDIPSLSLSPPLNKLKEHFFLNHLVECLANTKCLDKISIVESILNLLGDKIETQIIGYFPKVPPQVKGGATPSIHFYS